MMWRDRCMNGRSKPSSFGAFGDFSCLVKAKDCPKKRRGEGPARGKSPFREKGLATASEDATAGGQRLICATCGRPITQEGCRMEVGGAHTHGFTNPHGQYYDIGCFASAPGCAFSPESSLDFTWFAGYRWRLGVCRGCGTHMGWFFESTTDSFVALILGALIVERPGQACG